MRSLQPTRSWQGGNLAVFVAAAIKELPTELEPLASAARGAAAGARAATLQGKDRVGDRRNDKCPLTWTAIDVSIIAIGLAVLRMRQMPGACGFEALGFVASLHRGQDVRQARPQGARPRSAP